MDTIRRLFLLALAATLAAACGTSGDRGDGSDSDTDTDTDTDTDADTDADTDSDSDIGCDKMDILFVIDDSGSMACEQEMLATAFPGFIGVLEDYNNANADQISYRIGVTSTGRTLNYLIDSIIDVPMSESDLDGDLVDVGGAKWIDGPGDTAAITAAFTEAASLGTGGTSFEMPLECMREALQKDTAGGNNEGFLRDDSLFIAVVITDEDDCSRTDNDFTISHDQCMTDTAHPAAEVLVPLEEFRTYLNGRFASQDRWVFVTISGATDCDATSWASSSCDPEDTYAGAFESVRLIDWMNNYVGVTETDNGVFADICTTSLPDALEAALAKMTVACDEYVIE